MFTVVQSVIMACVLYHCLYILLNLRLYLQNGIFWSLIIVINFFGSRKESSDSFATRHLLEAKAPDEVEVEMERCPNCWKLFPVNELPLHAPICQDAAAKKRRLSTTSSTESSFHLKEAATHAESEGRKASLESDTGRRGPAVDSAAYIECTEQCPHCLDLFPLDVLIFHAEICSLASSNGSTSSSSVGRPISRTPVDGEEEEAAAAMLPVFTLRNTSMEQCPYCSELLPITELIAHCDSCGKHTPPLSVGTTAGSEAVPHTTMVDVDADSVATKRARYTLESFEKSAVGSSHSVEDAAMLRHGPIEEGGSVHLASGATAVDDGSVADRMDELEQCVHCLKEFPISELVTHATTCSAAAKEAGAEVDLQKLLVEYYLYF